METVKILFSNRFSHSFRCYKLKIFGGFILHDHLVALKSWIFVEIIKNLPILSKKELFNILGKNKSSFLLWNQIIYQLVNQLFKNKLLKNQYLIGLREKKRERARQNQIFRVILRLHKEI